MISGTEFAKTGVKVLIEEINKNVVIKLLDKHYKTFASYQANKNNELNIITSNNNIKSFITNDNIMALQNFRSYTEMIWQRRLGHFYNEDLKNYLKLHNIIENYCDDFKISKMRRNPHNNQTPKASRILEIIHSDIIGPISKSYTGKIFILTIIDEFSRKSWLFLLKGKSEAIKYIIVKETLK